MTATGVTVVSFGYLHGPAPEATVTLDLRTHYRDPHVSPDLRYLTADDEAVRLAVLGTPGIAPLLAATADMVVAYLAGPSAGPITVAVGCAGGRHRAATVAMALGRDLLCRAIPTTVIHRDMHADVVER
ncbi:RNase adapter RapZ [Streptomyces sp. SID3343]|uniref:RapZ C-terminal domain-containing protein n=1 Tax=Streptomyces sp. SID3343 TaxID=2690260 RepID=UPI00136E6BBD|nr:ATPase [Streptomyces sp. SID3343]